MQILLPQLHLLECMYLSLLLPLLYSICLRPDKLNTRLWGTIVCFDVAILTLCIELLCIIQLSQIHARFGSILSIIYKTPKQY